MRADPHEIEALLRSLRDRSSPRGRALRLFRMGAIEAKVASEYLSAWLRGRFRSDERKAELRSEARVDAALAMLEGMGYLRGAVLKLGQALASGAPLVPEEYADTLRALHFQAPAMHYSLVREHLHDELGADPEEVFAEFEREAFAAASLGQVHRARLRSGELVAVKVQYPGIARTIRGDFANLRLLLQPLRLASDWSEWMAQLEEVERVLTLETDYRAEVEHGAEVRRVLAGLDDVVVPRTFDDLCTEQVIVMEHVDGVHVEALMQRDPPAEVRNRHAAQIFRATARLFHSASLLLADPNPGNFLFLDDGRLGLVDFGCMRKLEPVEAETVRLGYGTEMAVGEVTDELLRRCHLLTDEEFADAERTALLRSLHEWYWEPLRADGPYDFANPDHLRRGLENSMTVLRRRYHKAMPVLTWMNRTFCGVRSMAYLLRARVDLAAIDQGEAQAAGLG